MNNISSLTADFYKKRGHKEVDTIIGTIYLFCFLFGVPANIVSLLYFTRQKWRDMDLPTSLYTLTVIQDTVISLLSLNHGVTLLDQRQVWLPGFCAAHHILFQMSQRMSVFLVAALSITRTYNLLFPLKTFRRGPVLQCLAVLWILMTCFFVIPPSIKLVQITYHWEGGYCWAEPIAGKNISATWDTIDNAMDTAGLAFPVVPITVSCIISSYQIVISTAPKKRQKHQNVRNDNTEKMDIAIQLHGSFRHRSEAMKQSSRRATVTIILVTILYIIANIPLFINYVLYLVTITSFEYPGPVYSSPVMYFYSWNFTALLTTGLNASANPIIYLTRFKRYRRWIKGGCVRDNVQRRRSITEVNQSRRPSSVFPHHSKVSTLSQLTSTTPKFSTEDVVVIPNLNVIDDSRIAYD